MSGLFCFRKILLTRKKNHSWNRPLKGENNATKFETRKRVRH
ncbi:hypothetical protein LEP1GSC133_4299 [Leptospira borgpetersenii serovar Pomona str. 200901868]|uniref:Uncharacterized protein n=1 Tax=Leptospira borgpetersenii serovar Pomona str. 200901868 TaxID=1192866 RepID=M6W0Z0_LEPBO|nr:hypothetical protein LEP1GSC133_4299 [Leptospira borgpetersenii serovar Pomona str. 200901868]